MLSPIVFWLAVVAFAALVESSADHPDWYWVGFFALVTGFVMYAIL